MEDSDFHQERKRPRLDGGDALAADEALTDTGCPEQQTNVPSQTTSDHHSNTPSPEAPVDLGLHETTRKSSSMVTINTRPSSSTALKSPLRVDGIDESASVIKVSQATEAQSQQVESGSIPHSSGSSPPRSPEIQIAEPEDIDQDPNLTRWRSSNRGSRTDGHLVEIDSSYVFNTFPRAQYYDKHKTDELLVDFYKDFRFGRISRLSNPCRTDIDRRCV